MNRISRERELIEGFLDGEQAAFETFSSWVTSVLNLRSWHSSIREAKDDIKQDVLTALVENFRENRYRGKGLKAYVSSVTKFKCLRVYDQRTHVTESETDFPDDEASVLEELILDEELSAIRHATQQLRLRCRKILAMRFYNNMSHNQIAEYFGATVETSRQWLKRCIDQLRKLMGAASKV
jgi:RNA polymerase sigma factor (sigma-70 family)